ncbi:unnamed protein product [Vitrella brassicaformis CCMP3155]|uniref:F-box domain-containing protein n=2 Tax=Vitrella brassicaformis TaxID=1169539 RepID=A0A0G4EKC0_VITBC|nr:unnamed protein product [Vitrella brassicaformis CCMP3155]|mmetsp:Transcript_40114/g.100402  ORF Transcript_40114/g.100402 Transcript_40114/m.100402 type:complete len:194 (+) Transcript_40114:371-952(+)|eukprot:CEL96978.1 unnamed protein product [Vitrella brassicaformis CCMP3155]
MASSLSVECVHHLLGFVDCGKTLTVCERVATLWRQAIHLADQQLWRHMCDRHNIWQTGTRSRGRLPWKTLYKQRLCLECCQPAAVILNGEKRSLFPTFPLCYACLKTNPKNKDSFPRVNRNLHGTDDLLHFKLVLENYQNDIVTERKQKAKKRAAAAAVAGGGGAGRGGGVTRGRGGRGRGRGGGGTYITWRV